MKGLKKYKLKRTLYRPKSISSEDLFEFCVNVLVQKLTHDKYPTNILDGIDSIKTHNQWAFFIFGEKYSRRSEYLSQVKNDYSSYFESYGGKYKWLIDKIYLEHPNFFKQDVLDSNGPFEEMLLALENEIIASKENTRKNVIGVRSLKKVSRVNNRTIYAAELDIESDDDPKLIEGLPFDIKIGGIKKESRVLDFDRLLEVVYFNHFEDLTKYYGKTRIEVDTSWILLKIKERLSVLSIEFKSDKLKGSNVLISKYIDNKVYSKKISNNIRIPNFYNDLDESQKDTFKFVKENDITLIWGPPGTGKSHTLSAIIDNFYMRKERTLVICIANVAVDSITSKLVNLLEIRKAKPNQGEILRIGFTKNEKLIKAKYLFPDNQYINEIRDQVIRINKTLKSNNIDKKEVIRLKSTRQDLQEKLEKATNSLIRGAQVIFATSSKFFIEENLYGTEFDNLIIDEASMLSAPQFLGLCSNIKKRIVVTGDFRQLGPIVLSDSNLAKKWLNMDVFEYSGIDPNSESLNHPSLKQLLVQRRSNKEICSLINEPFYQGKLRTKQSEVNNEIIGQPPSADKIISYFRIKDSTVQFTRQRSRYNETSAKFIISLLNKIEIGEELDYEIGIITPYRGQVKLLNSLISQSKLNGHIKNSIRVGTIHAFQGSEKDLIIFDIVDTIDKRIGKPYLFETGKRLLNVALSRAKHKLIIVGDLDIFTKGKGKSNINSSVVRISKRLKYYQVNAN